MVDHNAWAIRRSLAGENPRCAGVVYRDGRWATCGKFIKDSVQSSQAGPSFYGVSEVRFKRCFQSFWFCRDSSHGCVASDHVIHLKGGKPPALPEIWPVDLGTSLTTIEASALGTNGFVLVEDPIIPDRRPESGYDFPLPPNHSPLDPQKRPPRRAGKKVNRRTLTESGIPRRNAGLQMIANVRILEQNVGQSSYSFQLHTISTTTNRPVTYEITISETPSCTCAFFVNSVSDTKPGHFFMTCKHMYHVYHKVLRVPVHDERPHQATLSRAEVDEMMRSWSST